MDPQQTRFWRVVWEGWQIEVLCRGEKDVPDFMLVDGYNVINAWPELIVFKESLEHARDKLVDILAGYGAYKDYRVVIVFDAHAAAGADVCYDVLPDKLQVVYTREGETADSYIEKMAYQLVREGRGVYVVTSDWAEQMVILGVGAWRVSARELRNAVLAMNKEIEHAHEENVLNRRRHELGNRLGEDILKRLDEMRRGR